MAALTVIILTVIGNRYRTEVRPSIVTVRTSKFEVSLITSVRLNCEQIQLVALDVIVGFVVSSGNRVTKQHFFEERH